MYYEEKVVNGILCYRTTPSGEWIPFTQQALTIALTSCRGQNEKNRWLWYGADAKPSKIEAIIDGP